MKKFIALTLLCLVFVFSMCGCDNDKADTSREVSSVTDSKLSDKNVVKTNTDENSLIEGSSSAEAVKDLPKDQEIKLRDICKDIEDCEVGTSGASMKIAVVAARIIKFACEQYDLLESDVYTSYFNQYYNKLVDDKKLEFKECLSSVKNEAEAMLSDWTKELGLIEDAGEYDNFSDFTPDITKGKVLVEAINNINYNH